MNMTGLVLAFPIGIITGILGTRAGLPAWIVAIAGAGGAIAAALLCMFLGLP